MLDLEVVRTSTNRPRTVCSVVIVPVGRNVENVIVNWVKVATGKWGSDKKGLIFCHDVVKLQSLAGKLHCGMCYSKLKKKGEHLQNWMEGEGRLLCATGALSAGMNIQNYGEPWSASDFIQESGRGGRKGGRDFGGFHFSGGSRSQGLLKLLIPFHLTPSQTR